MRLLVNSFMNACQKFSMRFFHCVSFPFLHLACFAFLARLFLFFAAAFPAWGRTDGRTHTRGKNVVYSVDRFGGLFFTYEQPGMRFSSMHAFSAVTTLYRLRWLRFSSSVFFPYCSPSKLLLHNNTTVTSSSSTGKYFALARLPSFLLPLNTFD